MDGMIDGKTGRQAMSAIAPLKYNGEIEYLEWGKVGRLISLLVSVDCPQCAWPTVKMTCAFSVSQISVLKSLSFFVICFSNVFTYNSCF